MKSYVIYDETLDSGRAVGYLFYYEKARSFVIELCEDVSEWDAPLLFQGLVKKGIYTVPREQALLWVRERVIPSGRQNIGMILKNHHLNEYDEMALLALSGGRCAQDGCSIEAIAEDALPEEIKERRRRTVTECFPAGENRLICLFRDNTVRRIELSALHKQCPDVSHLMKHLELFLSMRVECGGYSVSFGGSVEIGAGILWKCGKLLNVSADDFFSFARCNLIDTTQACEMLQCTRQNLAYWVKEGKIAPVLSTGKERIYTRGAVAKAGSD